MRAYPLCFCLGQASKQATNVVSHSVVIEPFLGGKGIETNKVLEHRPTDRPTAPALKVRNRKDYRAGLLRLNSHAQVSRPPPATPHHGQPPPPPTTTHMYKYDRCFPQRWAARLSRAVQRLTTRLSYITSLDTKRYDTRRTRRPGSATPDRPSAPFPHLFDVEPNPTHSRRLCLPALIP